MAFHSFTWRAMAQRPRRLGFVLAALVLAAWASSAFAKVECDPNNEYAITAAAGPWMIVVQSYTPPKPTDRNGASPDPNGASPEQIAHDLAHEMVLELRGKYDLPAYVFNRGKEEREKQEQEMQRLRQQQDDFLRQRGLENTVDKNWKPLSMKHVHIDVQFAVLVGGYKDMATARAALDKIRKLPAPSNKKLSDYACVGVPDKSGGHIEGTFINPFLRAFVAPNPLVPVEKPEDLPDEALKALNADESLSLLKCSKTWTLVIKEFYGANVVVQKSTPTQMLERMFGKSGPSTLNASANQAHEIATFLRKHMNMDAYVLHTRRGSIVAVGAYDAQNDPRLEQNRRLLTNFQLKDAAGNSIFQFLQNPLPMKIPKF